MLKLLLFFLFRRTPYFFQSQAARAYWLFYALLVPICATHGGEKFRPEAPAKLYSTGQIAAARPFPERLRLGHAPTELENQALHAFGVFSARTNRDDVSPLITFLDKFPDSAWDISLRTELGCEYYRTGWYSKAMESWQQVWSARGSVGPAEAQIAVHRAGSHLAELYARLGRLEGLRELLPQLDSLSLTGPDAQRVRGARDGLWSMENTPEIAFRCGPLALDRVRSFRNPTNAFHPIIWNSKSTTNGMSLTEIAALSTSLGMNYQMAFRTAGSKMIIPAVVHWKVGHYAALVREKNGLCLAQDPTFTDDTWASLAALDHEASGYFLVAPGPLPPGWRHVSDNEGSTVFGKGATDKSDPDATTPWDKMANNGESDRSAWNEPTTCGMASWDAHLLLVSLCIIDTPVGYRPPVGPPVFTTMRFTQLENERFGHRYQWSHNWEGYMEDDVLNQYENVWIYVEGSWLTFMPDLDNTNVFHCKMRNPGVLFRTSSTNYAWQFPDGTKRLYSTSSLTNNGTLRYIPLTAIADASGNKVSIGLSSISTVETLTDAIGQVTHFYYDLSDPGIPPSGPGDPFGAYVTDN